jgi:hypothetical protein
MLSLSMQPYVAELDNHFAFSRDETLFGSLVCAWKSHVLALIGCKAEKGSNIIIIQRHEES